MYILAYSRNKTWHHVAAPSSSFSRNNFSLVPLGDDVLILGGRRPDGRKCECLESVDRGWRSRPDMLDGMEEPIAAAMRGQLWVVFNTTIDNTQDREKQDVTLQCLSLDTDDFQWAWMFKQSLPLESNNPVKHFDTSGATAFTHDDLLFVVGGSAKLCLCYYSSSDSWRDYASTPQPRYIHHGGYVEHVRTKLLLLGGYEGRKWNDFVEELKYTEKWSKEMKNEDSASHKWERSRIRLPSLDPQENVTHFTMSYIRLEHILGTLKGKHNDCAGLQEHTLRHMKSNLH